MENKVIRPTTAKINGNRPKTGRPQTGIPKKVEKINFTDSESANKDFNEVVSILSASAFDLTSVALPNLFLASTISLNVDFSCLAYHFTVSTRLSTKSNLNLS